MLLLKLCISGFLEIFILTLVYYYICVNMKTGFGWIKIKGSTYDHDIVIHVDGSITRRKKKASKPMKGAYGHTPLSEMELDIIGRESPEVVMVGTGQYGNLPITPIAQTLLSGHSSVVKPTPSLLEDIAREKRSFVAILHVTC